ncbi:MAG TPA: hypothetical protein PLZ55_07960 [bacterium]|nr:hypothetical protein [bacterium]HPO08587.1 hypothetical protein [bacterium]HQO33062.1 hypothetical protein [bacterium]HQP98031.1 hypothetical protein [bacterium]
MSRSPAISGQPPPNLGEGTSLLGVCEKATGNTQGIFEQGDSRTALLLATAAFVLFWFFRAVEMTGGDSDQWFREIEGGIWLRKRQMLSFGTMQLTYTVTHWLWGWDGRWAINLVSCLAGFAFVYWTWRLVGAGNGRWMALGLIGSCGFMQLFYGHIETYAMPMACLMLLFLTCRRYLAGQVRAITVAAVFSLGIFFHLIFWFLLPIFIPLLLQSRHRRRDALQFAMGLAPAILLTLVLFRSDLGNGEMVGDRFMSLFHIPEDVKPGSVKKRYALFSFSHGYDWLWFAWNSSHLTALIVLAGVVFRKIQRSLWSMTVTLSLVCFLIFTFIWHPDRGRMDWDLFSFTGLPMAFLAVDILENWRVRWGRFAAWLLICISAFLLGGKVADAARLGHRGEGTILIHLPDSLDENLWSIVLDGYAKTTEIGHVLEGSHEVSVYYRQNGEVVKHSEKIEVEPGGVYEVRVPQDDSAAEEQ